MFMRKLYKLLKPVEIAFKGKKNTTS